MNVFSKFNKCFLICIALLLIVTGCSQSNTNNSGDESRLKVVTSFTIIQDMAREIGGDDIIVYNLVPTGTDPHEYEPLPEDIKRISEADVLFYNGLNLEGGEQGWFFRAISSTGQKLEHAYSLTERVEPMYIGGGDGHELEINPHAFIDPEVGVMMAEAISEVLIERDPSRKQQFQERADEYIQRLEEVVAEYDAKLSSLPDNKRILVTSERAFQYMAARYGLEEGFIWEIDTEENGTIEQIKSLITFINERDVPVLFVESNVDPRPMEMVSSDTGVPIASKKIYSDEIGKAGDEADTYYNYLKYNIDLIYSELNK